MSRRRSVLGSPVERPSTAQPGREAPMVISLLRLAHLLVGSARRLRARSAREVRHD
jgi:hypothetical protein